MNRKAFIKKSCLACLSVTTLPMLIGGCYSMQNITGNMVKDGIVLDKEVFQIKDGKNSSFKSFVIVRNEQLKYPVCVYRINNNEYSALWMQCTHQGAELQASGEYLQCPAHGSEFNNKGIVTGGPAGSDLRTFPVIISETEIFIDLRKQA